MLVYQRVINFTLLCACPEVKSLILEDLTLQSRACHRRKNLLVVVDDLGLRVMLAYINIWRFPEMGVSPKHPF